MSLYRYSAYTIRSSFKVFLIILYHPELAAIDDCLLWRQRSNPVDPGDSATGVDVLSTPATIGSAGFKGLRRAVSSHHGAGYVGGINDGVNPTAYGVMARRAADRAADPAGFLGPPGVTVTRVELWSIVY